MRHKQKSLNKWLNPTQVWLSQDVLKKLREFDQNAEDNIKKGN
jgi:hypothetical protein